jgi:hypothetical protein
MCYPKALDVPEIRACPMKCWVWLSTLLSKKDIAADSVVVKSGDRPRRHYLEETASVPRLSSTHDIDSV